MAPTGLLMQLEASLAHRSPGKVGGGLCAVNAADKLDDPQDGGGDRAVDMPDAKDVVAPVSAGFTAPVGTSPGFPEGNLDVGHDAAYGATDADHGGDGLVVDAVLGGDYVSRWASGTAP